MQPNINEVSKYLLYPTQWPIVPGTGAQWANIFVMKISLF